MENILYIYYLFFRLLERKTLRNLNFLGQKRNDFYFRLVLDNIINKDYKMDQNNNNNYVQELIDLYQ